MRSRVAKSGNEETEQRSVRKDVIRRAAELAMIRGRQPDQPTHEDLQQAKREVKPLDMHDQERE